MSQQLVKIKLTKDVGPHKKGQVLRYDPASAKQLVESKRGEAVKEPAQDA